MCSCPAIPKTRRALRSSPRSATPRRSGDSSKGKANPRLRRVERPPYDVLRQEIAATSYSAVGRKYGVSDNAIRKWLRQYEREQETDAAPG
jgi:hypothetical protein